MTDKIIDRVFDSRWVLPRYRIVGCATYEPTDTAHFRRLYTTARPMQTYFDELNAALDQGGATGKGFSVIRLGDGEALFLRGEYRGTIAERDLDGSRFALIDRNEWKAAYRRNDVRAYDPNPDRRALWVPIEGASIIDEFTPLTPVYALIATRSLFASFRHRRIGLIGSASKLALIRELMRHKTYRRYLGVESFDQYVTVPDRGLCLRPNEVLDRIITGIGGRPCDLYLVGIGIAKLLLLAEIRDRTRSVVIDVGIGIDALAGLVPNDRGYFGEWQNFRLYGFDYKTVDELPSRSDVAPRVVHLD